jgi:hypothetical protein
MTMVLAPDKKHVPKKSEGRPESPASPVTEPAAISAETEPVTE